MHNRARKTTLASLALGTALVAAGTTGATAQAGRDEFVQSIKIAGLQAHLKALFAIAEQNDGNRASGTRGYRQSVNYVVRKLEAAGYEPTVQPFDYVLFTETGPSRFRRLGGEVYVYGEDQLTMSYSGNGDVVGRIVPADGIVIPATPNPSSQSGCDPEDFPPATRGNIALIQRGFCDFVVKAQNAVAAGAIGVVVFNEGNANVPDRIPLFAGNLGSPVEVPVISASYEVGVELFNAAPGRYRLSASTEFTPGSGFNVLADTPGGRPGNTIVVGAHLDSVPDGAGINDNGSGSAAILEIAEQMSALDITPKNRVRFAFWGAEEDGLVGSQYYVDNLTQQQYDQIALNLNFDMLGSTNFVRFVYDGDGSDSTPGPAGSAEIERVFTRYFAGRNLASAPTAFDGRSDYGPFIAVGIPAGGLFSGAEGIKTPREARLFGGEAGVAYDTCYHAACDDFANISDESLLQLSRAAADSVYHWATRAEPFPPANRKAGAAIADTFLYKGPQLKR